jgi:hypothetical protein
MKVRSPLFHVAANPRLALACALGLVLLLQVAVGGTLDDLPVTPTDGEGSSSAGP